MINIHDKITDVLDTIEDLRGEEDIVAELKEAYPALSMAFLAHIVRFEAEIQKISPEKEVTYVIVKGEQELCKVFSVDERGYTIQASMVDVPRGIHERRVGHDRIAERRYE